jgi:hypothetical protein
MRRAYLDCEFTVLNHYTYKLISLAFVVPNGPELYVELTDAWEASDCSDLVLEIVLPQLNFETHGRKTDQARVELLDFLKKLGPVEIISDVPQWDWPLLIRLAGPLGLPKPALAGQLSTNIDIEYNGVEAPHHALGDARLSANLVEHSKRV